MTYTTEHPTLFSPNVEVRVSKRRKKTAGAHWEGDRIVVVVPVHLRGAERDEMVESLARRLARHRPHLHASDDHLEQRARALGRRYLDGVAPASIRWSTSQNKRWGSCTFETGEIRISERLRVAPDWVLDAVIVHELAHLIEPNHSPRFSQLEQRYPRRRDADVFLEGYALGLHMPDASGCTVDRPQSGGGPVDADTPAPDGVAG
ncbi:MAG: M48 family metallopeptidase [Acidimicrobiales bacterium]|jgi:predicted metal-dependent hydrolase